VTVSIGLLTKGILSGTFLLNLVVTLHLLLESIVECWGTMRISSKVSPREILS